MSDSKWWLERANCDETLCYVNYVFLFSVVYTVLFLLCSLAVMFRKEVGVDIGGARNN